MKNQPSITLLLAFFLLSIVPFNSCLSPANGNAKDDLPEDLPQQAEKQLVAVPDELLDTTAEVERETDIRLINAIKKMDTDPDLSGASWGFYVKSLKKGKIVASKNANKILTPASTMKVVTTATAIAMLGTAETFRTQLAYDGTIDATGTLQGNLYIIGGGDPTLGTYRGEVANVDNNVLAKWVSAVKRAGIQQINGKILGDASFFDTALGGSKWLWEDLGNYYGARASGLNFRENQFNLYLKAGNKIGQSTNMLRIEPDVPNLQMVNLVTTGEQGSGDQAYIYGSPFNTIFYAKGTIPVGKSNFKIRGAVPDPAYFASFLLNKKLKVNNIPTMGAATARSFKLAEKYIPTNRTTIHEITSPSLEKIAYWVNKRSVNLFAESLLKLMGKRKYGKGNMENGIRAIHAFWNDRGLKTKQLLIHDGSGLSPTNGVSPKFLVDILVKMSKDANYTSFYNTLPIAGDPNDVSFLKSFMKGTAAAKKMHVKSGYISNVRTYTGYVHTKSKDVLAFAIMINNYTCSNFAAKKKIENLLKVLVEV